jgi:hypothetical protein
MTRDARLPSTSCRRGVVAPVVLMLFDPLAVPDALLMLAPEREPVIALTAPWHERDAQTLVERLDAALFAPSPDTAQDLVDKSGITAEQAGDGSPDLQWIGRDARKARWYAGGDSLPIGIEAYTGRERNDPVLWIDGVRAVVAGDSLVDFGTWRRCQQPLAFEMTPRRASRPGSAWPGMRGATAPTPLDSVRRVPHA